MCESKDHFNMAQPTKLLILSVVICTLTSKIGLASADPVSALIELSIELGAPFATTASKRIHSAVFGSDDATRSTNVAIINTSRQNFRLEASECKHGGHASDMFPETEISTKTSSVFRIESHGFASGVACKTWYRSENGHFKIKTQNPYIGKNSVKGESSENLRLQSTMGTGNNNQVRWVIYDN